MASLEKATSRPDGEQKTPAPSISLPKGGGAIRGIGEKFAANLVTGTGSMTIPIATSPGRSGFGPQLSLSYDSGSGNGPFGFGWSLSVPAITRKTDKGLPQYRDAEESDVYVLSGAEDLVPVLQADGTRFKDDTTAPGYTIHRYRPRIEGLFARIERWTNIATGEIHWRSITRDNVTTLYGKDNNSRIFDPADPMPANPTRVFSWHICESHDDKGNAIVYKYAEENGDSVDRAQANERNRVRTVNRYLKRIKYGNRTPNRDATTWQATDPAQLPNETWMFEVVFDYGEGHYTEDLPDAQGRIFAQSQIDPPAQSHWPVRQDRLSTYRAGFEVRTYRLCRRVLMFHHFPQELGIDDCLVRSTEFSYSESPIASFITSVTQSGYVRQPAQNQLNWYLKKSLPPLEFEYSQVPDANELAQQPIREVDAQSLENLPAGLDGTNHQWMDLDSEGTSGILTEQAGGWYYKRNLSANNLVIENGHQHTIARFGATEVVARKPAFGLAGGGQFLDLAGDGQVDLVQMEGPVRGFYERTDDADWERFKAFISWPDLNTRDPDLKFVDLTGDGHADILITEGEGLTWYPSLAEDGFGPAVRVSLPLDEEKGPRLIFADGLQSIYLADLSGDGLSDLVRIRNGEVCYWPNLGYGQFGAKVTMDNAPWFDSPDQFDQRRIRLADTDGSGTTDILYLRRDGVHIYFNQSGNSWSDAVALPQFPLIDNISSVQAMDLLGNGTACLVWSSPLPGVVRRPMRYLALMEQKPHLLVAMKNNLGAETKIDYAPSTKFYLDDELDGKPWVTRLPFPVHVVERVDTCDRISRNRFVTRYAYHHGYFDGVEREFRGFGMVEQWDTEEFAVLTEGGALTEATNLDAASHVPPVLTRTWFHTGAYVEGVRISRQFEGEYYREGDASRGEAGLTDQQLEAMLVDDTVLPVTIRLSDGTRVPYSLSGDEVREACRSLKGAILRQEIYALDKNLDGTATEESDRPYSASERNYTIELLQPQGQNRHAVFFTHARETVEFHYERQLFKVADGVLVDPQAPPPNARDAADPRVTHALTLEVDNYGNVLQSVAIGYGRRFQDLSLTTDDRNRQTNTLVTCTENAYTNAVLEADAYRTPLLCESRTYEVLNLTLDPSKILPDITNLFRFDDLSTQIKKAGDGNHDLPYEDINHTQATTSDPYRRLIEHVRALYRKNDLTGFSPLGTAESLALPGESYKLAFTPNLVKAIFADTGKLSPSEVSNVFGTDGGYVHSEGDANWWIPSGKLFYSSAPNALPALELAFARAHFFLSHRYRDPFGNEVIVTYDSDDTTPSRNHNLLLVETEDPLGNIVTVKTQDDNGVIAIRNDYRVLQPYWVTDPNHNRTQVVFDALGMVVATAVMGKPGENEGDNLIDFEADLTRTQIGAFHDALDPRATAATLLKGASTRIIYDLHRFYHSQQVHPTDSTQWEPPYATTLARETHASDPLPPQGLKIQISFSYSDGFGREIQKKIPAELGPAPKRDAAGKILVGADGQPEMTPNDVSPRWVGNGWSVFNNKGKPVRQYEPFFTDTHRFEFDVRIGVSPVLFYDPVERVVATLHPNHTWEKVVFNPWRQETWDVNDTVLVADPKTDADVGDFFSRLPDADYLPTWHAQRQGGALGPQEHDAVDKTAIHSATPMLVHFDVLGRTFLIVTRNKFKYSDTPAADPPIEEFHRTRIILDIEGNQREVRDAIEQNGDKQGRIVMRYDFDMLSNRIHHASMEAGERWMLNDVAGKPLYAWDSRDHQFRTAYDSLRRPTESYLREGSGPELLAGRTVYGESMNHPEAGNLRGKVVQLFDQAGVVATDEYDFKGNPLTGKRQLAQEYKTTLNWPSVPLDAQIFVSTTQYDALNRPTELTAPDKSVIRPTYNEANLLEQVKVNLQGAAATTPFVTNIDYDAKGQRTLIEYGNGVQTTYEYDRLTFRLVHLLTQRNAAMFPDDCPKPPPAKWPGCAVQNLHYTYDPTSNITHIRDDAQQTIYFRNKRIEPSADYTYDAIYRLIEATGREHLGQVGGVPIPHSYNDAPRVGINWSANDGNAMGTYLERYVYDAVGNFLTMRHLGSDPAIPGWTRSYAYNEASLLEPGKQSNRLSSTTVGNGSPITEQYGYDAQGNMTQMPHLTLMRWDFKDQLHATSRQAVNDAPPPDKVPETTFYVYDASGQRVRKVTDRQNGTRKEERLYLGGFEVYRKYNGDGATVTLARETLHIMDDKQRVALIETKTIDAKVLANTLPSTLIRYQYSNHLGSASLELDDKGMVISYEEYYPYGSTPYQAVRKDIDVPPRRYRYTGKERDEENGLYYHGARYYAAWLGRWTGCDPSGLADGINLYRYLSSGNPLRHVDSTGSITQNFPGAGLKNAQQGNPQPDLIRTSEASQVVVPAMGIDFPVPFLTPSLVLDDRKSKPKLGVPALTVAKDKQQELTAVINGVRIDLDKTGTDEDSDPLKAIEPWSVSRDCGTATTHGLRNSGYSLKGNPDHLTMNKLFPRGAVKTTPGQLTLLRDDQGKKLLDIVDKNLYAGIPVAVGIDVHPNEGAGGRDPDYITDHWAYIIGRSYDKAGRVFYLLADNASTGWEAKGAQFRGYKGYKQLQRLYVDPKTFTLVKPGTDSTSGPVTPTYVKQKYTIVNVSEVSPQQPHP